MFSRWTSAIFVAFHVQTVMSIKILCQSSERDETIKYGPVTYRTYVCDATFEKCCLEGCCNALPWYIWVVIATGAIVLLLALSIILFYLKMMRNVMRIRRQRRTLANGYILTTSSSRKSEQPPEYTVAVNLPLPVTRNVDQVPTYEEAIATK